MISITKEQLYQTLPQFLLIQDETLRNTTADIWLEACGASDWNALEDIPFMPGADAKRFGFLHHVALATQYSFEVALAYNRMEATPISVDHATAGALPAPCSWGCSVPLWAVRSVLWLWYCWPPRWRRLC